jgi:DNA-binding response OmpR family regulator
MIEAIRMTWPMYLRRQCAVGERLIHLSPREAELLCCLLMRSGYVSLGDLIEFVWPNPDDEPDWPESSLLVLLHRLRKKLGSSIMPCAYGRGYIIEKV